MSLPFNQAINVNIQSASDLEWKARIFAKGLILGKHHSTKLGGGMEFTQYRNYVQGDDVRLLDWKMYAKSNQYFIRQSEIESNNKLQVTIDSSKSMDYSEAGVTKLEVAKVITATLSYIMAQQGDQFAWESGSSSFPNSTGLKNWRRSVLQLDRLLSEEEIIPKAIIPIDGVHLWISDLYLDEVDIEKFITSVSGKNAEIVIFHLIGKDEESLDFGNNSKFIDLESGEHLYVNAKKFIAKYKVALDEHLFQIKRLCTRKGIVYRKIYLQSDLKSEMQSFLTDYNVMCC